jgi:hypothetical protein
MCVCICVGGCGGCGGGWVVMVGVGGWGGGMRTKRIAAQARAKAMDLCLDCCKGSGRGPGIAARWHACRDDPASVPRIVPPHLFHDADLVLPPVPLVALLLAVPHLSPRDAAVRRGRVCD